MNWIQFRLPLVVVVLLMSFVVSADDNGKSHLRNDEGLIPLKQNSAPDDVLIEEIKVYAQPATEYSRQSFDPNFSRNIGGNTGYQLEQGMYQAPLNGQPLDAQASVDSNKVVLVLNNDKNTFAELAEPDEEALKRLTRTPDVNDDIAGQFSKSFGEALANSNFRPADNFDFDQHLSQPILGATQGLLNLIRGQVAPAFAPGGDVVGSVRTDVPKTEPKPAKDSGPEPIVGIPLLTISPQFPTFPLMGVVPKADSKPAQEPDRILGSTLLSQLPQMPKFSLGMGAAPKAESKPAQDPQADQIVGSPLIPLLPPFFTFPLGMTAFPFLRPLMQSGSEISEVRVLPEQHSPYKISLKQMDPQIISENKLKAILEKSLTEKTLPILWFHLPTNHNVAKSSEDLEMASKLKMFEQQVIAELKQLQELSKMANEIKQAQLQSGVEPSTSLTTKLNLYEIPIYDITLGDIEKTLKDEQVIMLVKTIVQSQNVGFHGHHHANTNEDAAKTRENEDMLKMIRYAYRIAALHGHEMPWLNKKMATLNKRETTETLMNSQQGQMQPFANRHQQPSIMQEQQMPVQMRMMPPQMQQPMPIQNQMFDPNMPPLQQQDIQRAMMEQPMQQPAMQMPNIQQHQRHMGEIEQRPLAPPLPEQTHSINTANRNMGEAIPQMAESDGNARHAGFFRDLDIFDIGHRRGQNTAKEPTIINYHYYTNGGPPRYIPAGGIHAHHGHIGGYSGGHAIPTQHPPPTGHYGGGAYGSNAYGSSYGGYRTAIGEEAITAMLQQHQSMPYQRFAYKIIFEAVPKNISK